MFSQSSEVENTSLDASVAIAIVVLTCVAIPLGDSDVTSLLAVADCRFFGSVDWCRPSACFENKGQSSCHSMSCELTTLQALDAFHDSCHGLPLKTSQTSGVTASEFVVLGAILQGGHNRS